MQSVGDDDEYGNCGTEKMPSQVDLAEPQRLLRSDTSIQNKGDESHNSIDNQKRRDPMIMFVSEPRQSLFDDS